MRRARSRFLPVSLPIALGAAVREKVEGFIPPAQARAQAEIIAKLREEFGESLCGLGEARTRRALEIVRAYTMGAAN